MSITDARSSLISHNTSGNISWSEEKHTALLLASVMSAESEEQRAVRVLALGEQIHLFHLHAISREAGARMLSACWHIALGTPSE